MAAKNFKVKIVNELGTLHDELSALDGGNPVPIQDLKKLKSKIVKKEYRSDLKDITRYPKTHLADPTHLVLRMKKGGGDDVVFVCFEPFTILFTRDPEVDDDPDAPDAPFRNSANQEVIGAVSQFNGANPAGEQHVAGPFTVNTDASKQHFYKFSVQTLSGLSLDPCIITEN
jgi:hypothetical protein